MIRVGACLIVTALAALPVAAPAQQPVYKCVGGDGKVRYTDKIEKNEKGCTIVETQIMVVPGGAPAAAAPSPRAQEEAQRRKKVETELANEEKLLAEARKALAEQEAIRTGDERNYQRVLDRLAPYQQRVATHEKNVERLKSELSRLR